MATLYYTRTVCLEAICLFHVATRCRKANPPCHSQRKLCQVRGGHATPLLLDERYDRWVASSTRLCRLWSFPLSHCVRIDSRLGLATKNSVSFMGILPKGLPASVIWANRKVTINHRLAFCHVEFLSLVWAETILIGYCHIVRASQNSFKQLWRGGIALARDDTQPLLIEKFSRLMTPGLDTANPYIISSFLMNLMTMPFHQYFE